jgi:hypothetical protein
MPVFVKYGDTGNYGRTDPIYSGDRIVGYQILINPKYDDQVVSLAHELVHAAAGQSGKYGFDISGGWAIHPEAFRRQNEVALFFGYRTQTVMPDSGRSITNPEIYGNR